MINKCECCIYVNVQVLIIILVEMEEVSEPPIPTPELPEPGEHLQALPICFRCEEYCSTCDEEGECIDAGPCFECDFEDDCWSGREPLECTELTTPPAEIVKNVPTCFNCGDKCVGCKRVDNPKYCLQCFICDLRSLCSVFKGVARTFPDLANVFDK